MNKLKPQQYELRTKYKQIFLAFLGLLLFAGVESKATCSFSLNNFGVPQLPNTGNVDPFASNWLWINAGIDRRSTLGFDIECRRTTTINVEVDQANPSHKEYYGLHNLYYYNDPLAGGFGNYTIDVVFNGIPQGSGTISLKEAFGGGNMIQVQGVTRTRKLQLIITQASSNPPSSLRPPGFIRVVPQQLVRIGGGSINMSLHTSAVYGATGAPEVGPPGGWDPPPPGYEPECIPPGLKVQTPEEINFNSISQDQVANNRRLIRDFKINILRDKVSRDKSTEYCDDAIPGKLTFTLESATNGGSVTANGQDVSLNNGLLFGIEEKGVPITFAQERPFELKKAEDLLQLGYRATIRQDGNKNLIPGKFMIRTKVRIEY